jgi:hypothetical protein
MADMTVFDWVALKEHLQVEMKANLSVAMSAKQMVHTQVG